jgi:prephenate dehydrogenase
MKKFDCVAIAGVGLIGGSVGLALRARGLARSVVGFGSRPATLATAHERGAISEIGADLASAVSHAELVVVCAPVAEIVEQVRQVARHCRPGTLITDAGSTKVDIVKQLEQAALDDSAWGREVRFVGSHPLAGNEKKGPKHADGELFSGRLVVVTPTAATRPTDVRTIAEFWRALGATVLEMPAGEHDRALAATSHLPHLIAAGIAGSTPEEFIALTASGWQDTTRIAGGDPALWRQIMLANRDNLLEALDRFAQHLTEWRAALVAGDGAELERLLTEAKRIRDRAGS